MARQIEDIIVRLGLEKFEGLDKIRGAFRDLGRVTKMSEQDIVSARNSIFEFAREAGNTEAVTKGLVSALQGLRSQADICGDAYRELSRDIANTEAASRGYTAQALAQRNSLNAQYGAITNNTEALRRQRTALIELQQATRGGSQLFTQLGADIQRTAARLEEIEGIQKRTNATLSRGLPTSSAKIRRDLQDIRDRISLEQAELERLQTLTAAERRQFSQGTELRGQSGVTRAIAEQERVLATFRQQAGALDLSENVRQRREALRDANALFMSPEFTGTGSRTAEGLTRSFGDLPNTLAGINQGLSELRNRLDNTTIGTTVFTDAAIRAAAAQRELREATQGVAAAFVQQLRTGEIAPSLINLREVISSVRTEQGLLNTGTAEGAQAFALAERRARQLERQLNALETAQRNLASAPASGFREFSESITQRAGADAAVLKSVERAREKRGTLTADQQKAVDDMIEALGQLESVYARMDADRLEASDRLFRLEQERIESIHRAELQRQREIDAENQRSFQKEVERTDILLQQRRAAASALGFLGGATLSPLYGGIAELATASVRREQALMGRTATQTLTDIFTAFEKGGRRVDISNMSTDIGASVVQGIMAGATQKQTITNGANTLTATLVASIKRALRIQSPSGVTHDEVGIPSGQGITDGIVKGLQQNKAKVLSALQSVLAELRAAARLGLFDLTAAVQRPSLPASLTTQQLTQQERLQALLARTSARPTLYRRLTRLMGSEVDYSDAVRLAAERRAYEGATEDTLGPIPYSESLARIRLRGVAPLIGPGYSPLPGTGLEEEIRKASLRGVSSTGAFVGPLAGPLMGQMAFPAGSTVNRPFTTNLGAFAVPTPLVNLGQPSTLERAIVKTPQVYKNILSDIETNITVVGQSLSKVSTKATAAFASIKRTVTESTTALGTLLTRNVTGSGGGLPPKSPPGGGTGSGGGLPPKSPPGGGFAPTPPSDYDKLTEAIARFGNANKRSTADLREFAGQMRNFQEILDPTAADFTRVNSVIERHVGIVDRALERRQAARRPRLSGMQLAQGVGASLSGGIFGGPEGLIGGLAGMVLGGVGGAFAGAAAGAQVGMFRQQLGTFTSYSASIDKLQIALRGVVKTQAEYERALAASAAVTRDLNVPQETALRGLTRLSAAVKGAGGDANYSAFAFRAINEAIKATGGGAEQADGALLALTQVFSKGKVSAEELNQIAERLPGTFTLFAKAAGKTGPELTKALEQGKVGLNDLTKFLQLVSTQYGQTALKIAKSSQEAGARMTVAVQNMQYEVGRALQPLGAEFQSAFAVFITDITPSLVATAEGFVVVARAVGTATTAVTQFIASIQSFFISEISLYAKATAAFWGSIANDLSALWGRITWLFDGLAKLSAAAFNAIGIDIQGLVSFMEPAARAVADTWSWAFGLIAERWKETVRNMVNYSNPFFTALKITGIVDIGEATVKAIEARNAATAPKPPKPPSTKPQAFNVEDLFRFPTPPPAATTSGGSSKADSAKRDADKAAAEQQRLANNLLDQQLRAADTVFQHQIELDRQRYELQKRLDDLQTQNRLMRETGTARDILSNFEDLQRSLREVEERRVDARRKVALAEQAQRTAAARAAFAEQGAATLRAGDAGISATAIAKATAEAAKFTGIANQCSEAVKSFYKSLGITLPGVTAWADTVRNAGTVMRDWSKLRPGDIVATGRPGDTPHVGVYTGGNNVFHQSRRRGLTAGNYPDLDYFKSGYFVRPTQSAGTARMPTGAAAQQNRAIRASGGAVLEGLDVTQAKAQQQLIEANVAKERAALFEQFTLKAADSLAQQNQELSKNNDLQKLQNRLRDEGVSPERIQLETRLYEIRREQIIAESKYIDLLADPRADKTKLTATMREVNAAYERNIQLLIDAQSAQDKFNNSVGGGMRDGAQAYLQSIGSMREATAQLVQSGIKGVEDAIMSLLTTGTVNFREFAASILRDTARMITQQLMLRSVMQMFNSVLPSPTPALDRISAGLSTFAPIPGFAAANGGAFSNGIVPFAAGGVVQKPTMFAFANGGAGRLGLMSEAEPEAIMPLRRLPNGRLGVESANATGTPITVNVSVDAAGSQVQGNAAKGEQLGRAISQAVQEELIKQKRPGGLLAK